jgi:hypothetical protein
MREERNYDIYDKELVEILRSLEEWRALEEVCSYRRKNLQHFWTMKYLSRRQEVEQSV